MAANAEARRRAHHLPRTSVLTAAALLAAAWGHTPVARAGEIQSAYYAAPTDRYAHGVLGDAIEYGALVITSADGKSVRADLPENLVFEDVAPRLWDVTGDGAPEVIVVEADQRRGARLAIWTREGRLAATPFIGTRYRWLAPVGAADFDGDGAIEIAYVDRPHLAKTLRIWRLSGRRMVEVASARGVSNHRIGWNYIEGGVRDCGRGPEMVLASGDWRRVVIARLGRSLRLDEAGPYSPSAVKSALDCR
ncbi:MAG: VCBS repeat-containing protein [Pseudomonadota bacterium]